MDFPQHGNSSTTIENSTTGESDQNQCQEKRARRIAVIGDIMLDCDSHCKATRLCQEGPWPVLSIEREVHRLGGAGNVANMVRALGAECELLGFGCSCEDSTSAGVSGVIPSMLTLKYRTYVDGVLIGPRLDKDFIAKVEDRHISQWSKQLQSWRPDSIIVADHGKGAITEQVMKLVFLLDVPVFVDPVKSTPLVAPVEAIVGHEHEIPTYARSNFYVEKHGADGFEFGADLDRSSFVAFGRRKSAARWVVDPLGAGDQFIAALAYQRCLGVEWADAIDWANLAAGLQCERMGCVPVTCEDVRLFQRELGRSCC